MGPLHHRLAAVRTQLGDNHLETSPTVVLIRLFDSKGKVVPYEYLMSAVEFHRGYTHTSDSRDIHGYCKKIRKAIRRYNWPIEIKNHRGIGYQLLVADPHWRIEAS